MSEAGKDTKWPSVEFYQSNAKAEDIRAACIPILQKLHKLFYDPEVTEDSSERSKLYAQLELDNGKLLGLGIEPNMKLGRDFKEYHSPPLTAAEYLAGQLIKLTGEHIPAMSEFTGSVGENTVSLEDEAKIVEADDFSPQARDFSVKQQIFNFVKDGFAIDDAAVNPERSQ